MIQLTRKIKKAWIENLESGRYKQAQHCYKDGGTHCCLAVLDETIMQLTDTDIPFASWGDYVPDFHILVEANDSERKEGDREYANVLPIIKKLHTID